MDTIAKSRLVKTFKFLKELNELRNPVPRDVSGHEVLRIDHWPAHPCIHVQRSDAAYEEDEDGESDSQSRAIIRVERAPLTQCPAPPKVLEEWLKPGWEALEGAPAVLARRNRVDAHQRTVTVEFTASAERVQAFEQWSLVRTKWVEAERPAVEARRLFERLHELWTKLEREGDNLELALADGMLAVDEHGVRYPVLAQAVRLTFDPQGPLFLCEPGLEPARLHRSLLRLVPNIEARMIARFEEELEAEPITPLGGEKTAAFFRRLVQGLFTNGEYFETAPAARGRRGPAIWREPMLIVRPRAQGLSTTLDYVVEDLERDENDPAHGLARIVGVEPEPAERAAGTDADEATPRASDVEAPDILFSKPTNREQHQIAARLAKERAVLVQGPPGTGKTHTIANLLGCLLAQGKTVLVTAHTTKALRVLRDQVDKALQPLCLSVLDGGAESQAQLSHAAQAIAARLANSDATELRREAAALRSKRQSLLGTANELREQLRKARFSEIEELVCGQRTLRPIEAARHVKAHAATDAWIPAPLDPGASLPLSEAELRELYATQRLLTPSDEAQLTLRQPQVERLVAPIDFGRLALEESNAGTLAAADRPELWSPPPESGLDSDRLQQLLQQIQQAATTLSEESPWLREVLFSGWSGGDLKESWLGLVAFIEEICSEAGSAQRLIDQYGPKLPEAHAVDAAASTLVQIVEYLDGGGALGFKTKLMKRAWHQLIEQCRVDGKEPSSLDDFRALHALANLHLRRDRLLSRWTRMVEARGGPSAQQLGTSPERSAQAYARDIRKRLEWREQAWTPLLEGLKSCGFEWDAWLAEHPGVPGEHGELERLAHACSDQLATVVGARAAALRRDELTAALDGQGHYLRTFPESEAGAILLQAQATWNTDHYEQAYRELARLEGLCDAYTRRIALLQRISPTAPAWAQAITQRVKPHDSAQPPGDARAAWLWRQLHDELEHRAALSIPQIQERIREVDRELMQLAALIIEKETWAAQCERTGLRARQALNGFVLTIKRLGKGLGKRAPELRRQARNLLADARHAVPVWIMPLNRVYENFDARETKFDVVIIDEASQSDVTALAALYLGRAHVVVGDKEQVTPDAIGQKVDEVARLIATDLQGIPNNHLYDGQTSIYDLAETAFGGVVALREHFRCVPEIIQFCNHLSYGNAILPLREPLSAGVRPALIPHRVQGSRSRGRKTNEIEALEIASLIAACLGDEAYSTNDKGEPTSFGVVSLLGDDQALLIEKRLRERLTPDVFTKRRLLCGNAAQFQGDERDVIFLSMVDEPPEEGQLTYRDAGPKDLYKKRYNVAVSRARNQLWVVHSVDPVAHLKPGDLRRRLIEHAREPGALLRAMEKQSQRVDSIFEKEVLERLMSAGYCVETQVPVGAYRIDLVVSDNTRRRLAVECDGEQWHTPDQLHRDLERQAILERQGWQFVRIRGSVFFRDPDTAMVPVFDRLRELGIQAQATWAESDRQSSDDSLTERIRRAAEAIRREWFEQERQSA